MLWLLGALIYAVFVLCAILLEVFVTLIVALGTLLAMLWEQAAEAYGRERERRR